MIRSLNHVSVLTNIPFEIDEKRVLRELRIPAKESFNDLDEKRLGKELKCIIDMAYGLIRGRACYCTFQIMDIYQNRVILDKSETLIKGKKLVSILKNCEYCSLFVSTIGPELEDRAAGMAVENPSGAFYLDHVGSWMAEYIAGAINQRISRLITKSGFIPKRRYSAGYGDWPVTSQKEILELTEARRIGVSISNSYLMMPRKSVSALIGWGRRNTHDL